jgi:endonuclease YncB( thermonuclease family)
MKTMFLLLTGPALSLCLAACSNQAEKPSSPVPEIDRQADIAGTASVIDGDTIEIHGQRIRLSGFDAPERGARCGAINVYQKASLALADIIGMHTVTCMSQGTDRYGRIVATCSVNGVDLGHELVRKGWARDWPQYSQRTYAEDEVSARAAARGIWGLDCPDDLWGERTYD